MLDKKLKFKNIFWWILVSSTLILAFWAIFEGLMDETLVQKLPGTWIAISVVIAERARKSLKNSFADVILSCYKIQTFPLSQFLL